MEGIVALIQLVALAALVISIACWASIFSKAGYSGWLAALMLVPFVGIFLLVWFAFTTWPIERRLWAQGARRSGAAEWERSKERVEERLGTETPLLPNDSDVQACPNCGHQEPSGRTFCSRCGKLLLPE